MTKRDSGGCSTLHVVAVFTGLLASIYNGALIFWFYESIKSIHTNNEFYLALTVLLEVLMSLAAIHIAVSLLLIYGIVKDNSELVILWVIMYISSCCVVASLFTIGIAFLMNIWFLVIVPCNLLFIINIAMMLRLYRRMTSCIEQV